MRSKAASLSPARRCNGCATGSAPSRRRPRPKRSPTRADPRQRVYLVPGFAGLGAPYWSPQARGALIGLTAECGLPEIARATLEAVGYQTRDLIEAMAADAGIAIRPLRVDGGMAASDWTMQFLADILPARVERPASVETTAWGAAYVAGLSRGVYPEPAAMVARWRPERRFTPQMPADRARGALRRLAARRRRRAGGGAAVNLLSPPARRARGGDCRGAAAAARPAHRAHRLARAGEPAGFWYDQAEGEWVLLLAGAARLRFADEAEAAASRPRRLARHRAAPPPSGRMDRPGGPDRLARRVLPIGRRCAWLQPSPFG